MHPRGSRNFSIYRRFNQGGIEKKMKKHLFIFLFFGLFLVSITIIFALVITQVFYDGFENNDFATFWTSATQFTRDITVVDTGTYAILADGGGGECFNDYY